MKKAIVCLLAILLILAFASCNATPDSGSSSAGTTTEPSTGSGTIPEATDEQVEIFKNLHVLSVKAVQDRLTGTEEINKPEEKGYHYTNVSIEGGTLNGKVVNVVDQRIFNLTYIKESKTISLVGTCKLHNTKFEATVNGEKCMMTIPPEIMEE